MHSYTEETIQTLTPLEGIRKRLSMYTGSADNDSLHHAIKEAISNSIDEFLAGYGDVIEVDLDVEKNSIRIRDYGRGIPFNKIVDVSTIPHSGGKFTKEGSAYGASSGLNGTGMKILTATGTNTVTSIRDGVACSYTFDYTTVGERKEAKTKEKNGTIVEWIPDTDVVVDGNTLYLDKIKQLLEDFAYPTPGLTFVLSQNGKEIQQYRTNSINDFLANGMEEKARLSAIMPFKTGNDYLMVEGALVWANAPTIEKSYLNLVPTVEGGTHITALRTVLTRELNKCIGSDLKGEEIRKGMSFILSVKTLEDPIFAGQQKNKVNMPTLNAPLSKLLTEEIVLLIEKNKEFFASLEEIISKERKKEAAVAQVRQVLAKAKSKANPLPQKLKPALNKQGAELFVCEGE